MNAATNVNLSQLQQVQDTLAAAAADEPSSKKDD